MALSIKDIVELAKAGYKVEDVKELINMSSATQEQPDTAPERGQTEEANSAGPVVPEAATEQKADKPQEEPEQTIDYKKLYEESQAKVSALQKQNINQNISADQVNDEQLINDLVSSFM